MPTLLFAVWGDGNKQQSAEFAKTKAAPNAAMHLIACLSVSAGNFWQRHIMLAIAATKEKLRVSVCAYEC